MNWDDLRIFLHVARSGSVSASARSLELDHSTISKRISKLEKDMEIRLFERAGRRLRITQTGIRLQQAAQTMESVVLQKVTALRPDIDEVAGRVRIGAPEGLGAGYLGSRLAQIASQYPLLDLELVALPQNYSLASREVDIAITLDMPRDGNLFTRKLTDYRLRLYGTEEYRDQYGWPQTLKELSQHKLCSYIIDLLHTKELNYLYFDNQPMNSFMRSTSIIAQKQMVLSGKVIGILPRFLAAKDSRLIEIMSEAVNLTRSYWAVVHEDLRHMMRIRTVHGLLYQLIREDTELFSGAD